MGHCDLSNVASVAEAVAISPAWFADLIHALMRDAHMRQLCI